MHSVPARRRSGQAARRADSPRGARWERSAATISCKGIPNLALIPDLTRELKSTQLKTTEVIARFCLRVIVLVIFAAFGSIGFGRSLTALLWMSTILSAVLATLEREQPLDRALNHWDETMAYAALCCLVSGFDPVLI